MDIGNIVWSQQHQNMNKTTRLWHKHASQQANMYIKLPAEVLLNPFDLTTVIGTEMVIIVDKITATLNFMQ